MGKIKTAFFGLAHPHVSALLRTICNYPDDFEIIGFSDVPLPHPDPNTFEGRRKEFLKLSIPEFENWFDLIAKKPDFAVVNSDNASRETVCCALLSAGIHVLEEKPMAVSYNSAVRMYKCAAEHGVMILINWPIAWFPAFRTAKKMLDEGRIGRLMRVTYRSPATWGPFSYGLENDFPSEAYLSQSWWYHSANGGGSILDYACYGAMLSSWMFGRQADKVSGIKKNFGAGFADIEDYSAMILDFGDGVGLLEGSWSTYNPGEVPSGPILHGTDGVIVCDRHTPLIKLYTGRSHKPVPPTEIIKTELDRQSELLGAHLARVLRGEEKPDELLSPELNLAVTAALDAGNESAITGVSVETVKYKI